MNRKSMALAVFAAGFAWAAYAQSSTAHPESSGTPCARHARDGAAHDGCPMTKGAGESQACKHGAMAHGQEGMGQGHGMMRGHGMKHGHGAMHAGGHGQGEGKHGHATSADSGGCPMHRAEKS